MQSLCSDLDALAAGDPSAVDRLVADYYEPVRRMVHAELDGDFRRRHRWIMPLLSTGDVVHEVFCGVLRGIGDFRPLDEQSFLRYLATMVHHRLIDAVRHHEAARRDGRRQVQAATEMVEAAPADDDDPGPSTASAIAEQLELFRAALAVLSAREQVLVEQRLADEAPFAELAARLGYPSEDAARKAFVRAQARVLARLHARTRNRQEPRS